jgi:hypothetical protein
MNTFTLRTPLVLSLILVLFLHSGCQIPENPEIGKSYKGGLVAYILQPGDKGYIMEAPSGLIVSYENVSDGVQWYNGAYLATNAKDSSLFGGHRNTETIVTLQGEGNYAAKLCADYESEGYKDWYLPSIEELKRVRENYNLLNFDLAKGDTFWTSTEETDMYASTLFFGAPHLPMSYPKYSQRAVRAVRRF